MTEKRRVLGVDRVFLSSTQPIVGVGLDTEAGQLRLAIHVDMARQLATQMLDAINRLPSSGKAHQQASRTLPENIHLEAAPNGVLLTIDLPDREYSVSTHIEPAAAKALAVGLVDLLPVPGMNDPLN